MDRTSYSRESAPGSRKTRGRVDNIENMESCNAAGNEERHIADMIERVKKLEETVKMLLDERSNKHKE